MEFDEINDMAIEASKKKELSGSIAESIITLMNLAYKNKIDIEDALLNKIEEMNKK